MEEDPNGSADNEAILKDSPGRALFNVLHEGPGATIDVLDFHRSPLYKLDRIIAATMRLLLHFLLEQREERVAKVPGSMYCSSGPLGWRNFGRQSAG